MVYINSGNWVDVGDKVWGRAYTGNGNKPKLVCGVIISTERDCYTGGWVSLKTARSEYRLPANVLHLKKPIVVEDELGKLTIWGGLNLKVFAGPLTNGGKCGMM